jgi:hypothetical protein
VDSSSASVCVHRDIMVLKEKHNHISYSFHNGELNVRNMFLFVSV